MHKRVPIGHPSGWEDLAAFHFGRFGDCQYLARSVQDFPGGDYTISVQHTVDNPQAYDFSEVFDA